MLCAAMCYVRDDIEAGLLCAMCCCVRHGCYVLCAMCCYVLCERRSGHRVRDGVDIERDGVHTCERRSGHDIAPECYVLCSMSTRLLCHVHSVSLAPSRSHSVSLSPSLSHYLAPRLIGVAIHERYRRRRALCVGAGSRKRRGGGGREEALSSTNVTAGAD